MYNVDVKPQYVLIIQSFKGEYQHISDIKKFNIK